MRSAFALIESLKSHGVRTDNIRVHPSNDSVLANLFLGSSQPLPIVLHGDDRVSVENTNEDLASVTDCTLVISNDPTETARELRDLILGYYL